MYYGHYSLYAGIIPVTYYYNPFLAVNVANIIISFEITNHQQIVNVDRLF